MGTNFYFREGMCGAEQKHIGKRSAAGAYCFKCGITLCKKGRTKVHYISWHDGWWDKCPLCKEAYEPAPLVHDEKTRQEWYKYRNTHNVRPCASFGWDMDPDIVRVICTRLAEVQCIEDEYGEIFTGLQFWEEVICCPLWHYDCIDRDFT